MKIALLSNVTVEVLAGLLRKEHRVWTPSGFGAWMETALEPPPELVAFAPELVCLLIDRRFGAFDAVVQDVGAAVERLKARFPKAAVIVPDVARLAADLGEAFYDAKMWALGRMPFSLKGLRELAKVFSRKKVLAVDLDNTLWKGVIGEDGVAGIVPYVPFQEKLLELKRRGILLVALSKNNPADVEPAWADARMALKASDWVVQAIGWNAKPDSLAKVAAELNLGTDSFVFVDDNPVERAEMRAARPDVTVADFPPQLDVFFPFGATTLTVSEPGGDMQKLVIENEGMFDQVRAESDEVRKSELKRKVKDKWLSSDKYPNGGQVKLSSVRLKKGTIRKFCGLSFGALPPYGAKVSRPAKGDCAFFIDYRKAKCRPFMNFEHGRAEIGRSNGAIVAIDLHSDGAYDGLTDAEFFAKARKAIEDYYEVKPRETKGEEPTQTLVYGLGDVDLTLGPDPQGGFRLRAENTVLKALW